MKQTYNIRSLIQKRILTADANQREHLVRKLQQ